MEGLDRNTIDEIDERLEEVKLWETKIKTHEDFVNHLQCVASGLKSKFAYLEKHAVAFFNKEDFDKEDLFNVKESFSSIYNLLCTFSLPFNIEESGDDEEEYDCVEKHGPPSSLDTLLDCVVLYEDLGEEYQQMQRKNKVDEDRFDYWFAVCKEVCNLNDCDKCPYADRCNLFFG